MICGSRHRRTYGDAAARRASWQLRLVERAPALRVEGYMIDFFGPGCDAAEDTQLALDLIRN